MITKQCIGKLAGSLQNRKPYACEDASADTLFIYIV
jgi:hypothetical protein